MKIIIGSRGSKLALWQADWTRQRLESADHEIEIKVIKTTGDKLQEALLAQSGTKGLFIKEIEEALLAGSIDLAVHSLKDLPTEQPQGLYITAVPEREDARDVLVSAEGTTLAKLPSGARLATGSLRRQAQLRRLRTDLQFISMRGNIDTRLRKLERGDSDALVLAAAGMRRLGLESRITSYFTEEEICPAIGQGALAIELRRHDLRTRDAVAPLDDLPTHQAVRAERAVLSALGGGCQLPIAAYASVQGDEMQLMAVVASPDGKELLRASAFGTTQSPEALGERVARDLFEQGANSIIQAIK